MTEPLIEHWDDLRMTVIFTQEYEYAINFCIVEIAATDVRENGKLVAERAWLKKDWHSSADLIYDPQQAEILLEGFVKWDGCSEITFGDHIHLCGWRDVESFSKTLLRVFTRCGMLLGDRALDGEFPKEMR